MAEIIITWSSNTGFLILAEILTGRFRWLYVITLENVLNKCSLVSKIKSMLCGGKIIEEISGKGCSATLCKG